METGEKYSVVSRVARAGLKKLKTSVDYGQRTRLREDARPFKKRPNASLEEGAGPLRHAPPKGFGEPIRERKFR